MTDLSTTIAPRSDQLNADDLIAGPRTILITKVGPGAAEQPIAIHYEGDGGKPYLPCKGMRRVLVDAWGPDGATYPGRSMTLYRDPEIMFGKDKVGGIRISHLSHIERDRTLALTVSRASRKPFVVRVLKAPQKPADAPRASAAMPGPDNAESPSTAAPSLAERVEKAEGFYAKAAEPRHVDSCNAKFAPLREECAAQELNELVDRLDAARTEARKRVDPDSIGEQAR